MHDDLTARERDILALLTKGYENQRIADELFISLKTVKTHVSNILSKLEVSDRTQAVVYAFRHHLVNQEDFKGKHAIIEHDHKGRQVEAKLRYKAKKLKSSF